MGNARFGSDYYDHEYFEGSSKSVYGKLYEGGYTRELFMPHKIKELIYLLGLSGYTSRWLPKTALVAGCGPGYMVEAMQLDGNIEGHGVDISEYAISRGRSEGVKNLRVGDICQLHFTENEFEFVVCCDTLELIPEDFGQLAQAIDELVRVCNGFICITTRMPSPQTDKELGESYHSIRDPNWWVQEFEKRGVKTYHQSEQIETMMAVSIFKVIQ